MSRVVAVVVTFQPERSRLARALERLRPQVAAIVVVDNSDDAQAPVLEAPTAEGVELIANGRNLGIGQAQNQGIARARALGATHVLLMDQDSLAPPRLVPSLLRTLAAAGAQPPVAVVGPVCRVGGSGAGCAARAGAAGGVAATCSTGSPRASSCGRTLLASPTTTHTSFAGSITGRIAAFTFAGVSAA